MRRQQASRKQKPDQDGNLILLNKPYGVLSQFSGDQPNLSDYISLPGYYPAGRLDKDSEGLLLLTCDGGLQTRIADPKFKMNKTYWVQVEGEITSDALRELARGVRLKDGLTRPARARAIDCPLPPREPAIRVRQNKAVSWLELTINEGKNRQVRRMTASIGHPTLRLFRTRIGPWAIENGDEKIAVGEYRLEQVNLPR